MNVIISKEWTKQLEVIDNKWGGYMLYIPPTSKDIYVSSKVALNIHSPDDTGDWHSSVYLDNDRDDRQELFIFGTGQRYNTNSLLGSTGVIDGTDRLNKMGYCYETTFVKQKFR